MKVKSILTAFFLLSFFITSFSQSSSDVIISEYVEGSSNNKAIEFFNGTSSAINFTTGNYIVQYYFNGSATPTTTITLTGTIAPNGVFVLANASASFAAAAFVNQTNTSTWYNGDDAIVLRKGGASGALIDVIGQVGFDPGTEWGTGLVSTADNTIRRKPGICSGDINQTNIFDPSLEWDGFAMDNFSGLGTHTSSCSSGGQPIVINSTPLNFTGGVGTASPQQSYTIQANGLLNDLIISVPPLADFGIATSSGGPYTSSITVPATVANAAPVTVYVVFSPQAAGVQSGNITHVSGAFSANLAVQGIAAASGGSTRIYEIQGAGAASSFVGNAVTTEGVVTGYFQGANQLNGFFIQDTTGDANNLTSDGIFILDTVFKVSIGDYVQLTGLVAEAFTKTEIKSLTALSVLSTGNTIVNPVDINLPVAAITDLERYEGMLVRFPQTLTASETFTLGRFGEVALSANGRLLNPTNFIDPNDNPASGNSSSGTANVAAVTAQQDLNNRSRILLDDGSTVQNPPVVKYLNPVDTTLRIGSTLNSLTGNLDFDFNVYRLQPTIAPVFNYALRPAVPSVGAGNIIVTSFNVLNYFNGDGAGGGFPTSRGANTLIEFNRQRTKIIAAIKGLNASVAGLTEIENDGDGANAAIADLVNGLNAATAPGTYAYINDPTGVNGNTGTDQIKVALIYKPAIVTPQGLAVADISSVHNRPPLAQTFVVNGTAEKFSVVVNHFKSKGCTGATGLNADQLDGQGCFNNARKLQAAALLSFIDTLKIKSGDLDVVTVGDYNAYEEEDPIDILRAGGLINAVPGAYSYVFGGQSGALDYVFTTPSLSTNITGADKWHINADEPVVKDYNQEFNPAYTYSADAYRSSDHDPVLLGLNLQPAPFTLQLLHGSDFESGPSAPNFAAIIDTLEGQYRNTIILSSGDNWIPSPFYNAASDRPAVDPVLRNVYNQYFGANSSNFLRAAAGRADGSILNLIGVQASALGNHEFDAGTSAISDIIGYEISGTEVRWMGAQYPSLSCNLDFSGDASLAPLFTNQILPNTAYLSRPDTLKSTSPKRKISPATIINVNGTPIGVVGATTQILESISSTGGVKVKGSKTNNMAELATYIQPFIDSLTAKGINKIIVLCHLQQIAFEKELIGLLRDVDIVVAGGSSTLLSDANDVLRAGDISAGVYPYVTQNANGQPALVVNTDQEYKYVGRLVADFDNNGSIILSSLNTAVNGVYATTDQTVINLWGSLASAFAPGTKGNLVKTLVDGVNGVIIAQDGNIIGKTNVYLEGRRIDVRTQETNLGNLSSDANLAIGKLYDPSVAVAVKNGGGIRTSIGEIRVNPQTNILEELPPSANPLSGKQAGEISQLDAANSLRFNNSLSLVTVTASQLLRVLNHGVAATVPGATPGQFAQVGGVAFSFDASLPAGSRVRNAVITDSIGNVVQVLARNGVVQGDSLRPIRVVTLSFLLTGGDSYPFNSFIAANPTFANRVDLVVTGAARTGNFIFADNGSEQDAFAEYVGSKYNVSPYNILDTDIPQDKRIQNLALRNDSILPNQPPAISITSPLNNSSFGAGAAIVLNTVVADADGTITKVAFYNNGLQFAEDSTAPYLFTASNAEAGIYKITARAFDNAGDSAVSDTVTINVTACTASGSITAEGYANIPGSQVADLTGNAAFPNNPSVTASLNIFEYGNNLGDNYGARVRGYICVPQTGNYTFYIAADDQAGLWLSTDENPANKILIAYTEVWTNPREWFKFSSQKSVAIRLVKGGRYYIETLHKELVGTDHLAVAWTLPDGFFEGPISGNRLSPWPSVPMVARKGDFNKEMKSKAVGNNNLKGLKVTATPNPSPNEFIIVTKSSSDKPLNITVTDVSGRIIERRSNVAANGTLRIGNKLPTGIYLIEVMQGTQKERLKLMKQ